MLKYTIAACSRIVKDLKILAHTVTIIMQSVMIVYLTFAAIVGNGSRAINITLASLTAANLVFYLITYGRNDKKSKKVRGAVSRVYVWAKLSLNAISLASVIYSIYASAAYETGLTVVVAPIMIVLWVAQVLFQIIKAYVENRAALFTDGLRMDFEFVMKPVNKAKNIIHDFFGEEREEHKSASEKNKRILTAEAEEGAAAKREKRSAQRRRILEVIRSKFAPDSYEPETSDEEDEEPTVAK